MREAVLVSLLATPIVALGIWLLLGGGRADLGTARWSVGSRLFHWLMALCVLGAASLMFWMQGIDVVDDASRARYRGWLEIHKSLGLSVLLLVPLRMLWNLAVPRPPLAGGDVPARRYAVSAVHGTLYALMLAIPVAGYLAVQAYGGEVHFFGLFRLPTLIGPDDDIVLLFYYGHVYGAWLLLCLVGGHVAAALWHHLYRRDPTLLRMLPLRSRAPVTGQRPDTPVDAAPRVAPPH